MRNIWNKIVAWLQSIPADKKMHFVAGFIVAAFFGMALPMKVVIIPALFAGIFKEFFDKFTTGVWEWGDLLATIIGGAVPQVFILLNLWWFPVAA